MTDEWTAWMVVAFIIAIAIVFGCLCIQPTTDTTTEPAPVCEHEFVVTSKYSIWLRSYKTFSKCIHCGLEV